MNKIGTDEFLEKVHSKMGFDESFKYVLVQLLHALGDAYDTVQLAGTERKIVMLTFDSLGRELSIDIQYSKRENTDEEKEARH